LLTVALRRLTEPSTRKIAAPEPPSSAGHNDVPHADLARVSMGRDAGQGAYPGYSAVVLGRPLAVSAVAAGPVRLAAHRLFMVIVAEARSQLAEAARRRSPASLPSICSHGAQFDKIELTLARRE